MRKQPKNSVHLLFETDLKNAISLIEDQRDEIVIDETGRKGRAKELGKDGMKGQWIVLINGHSIHLTIIIPPVVVPNSFTYPLVFCK